MLKLIKSMARWAINQIQGCRDLILTPLRGVYLRELLPKAKFSKEKDCYTNPPLIKVNPEDLLILIPCRDVERFIPTMEKNLIKLIYPKKLISIGILEGGSSDNTYEVLQTMTKRISPHFSKVDLLRKNFDKDGKGKEKRRWAVKKQSSRRERLAHIRNYLLEKCLAPHHKWVLWIDSDVIDWDEDVIERLMSFGKDFIVPRCVREDNSRTYDLNSFKYKDNKKRNWKSHIIDGLIQPTGNIGGRWGMDDLTDYDLVSLDGIGGTMVLVRAELHRKGLIYPPQPYHLHIETEAMAFMARDMGYETWAAPKVVIVHPIYH